MQSNSYMIRWFFCIACLAGCGGSQNDRYSVYVQSAEIAKTKSNGQPWDGDNSGPDVYYEILWGGNRVFKSSAVPDSTIPTWREMENNLGTVARTQVLEPRDNAAVVMNRDGADTVSILFYDDDLLENDPIGAAECIIAEGEWKLNGTGTLGSCNVRIGRQK